MIIHRNGNEYAQCELCPTFVKFENAATLDWDWFTGSLPRSHHYCRKHKASPQRHAAYLQSRTSIKPKPKRTPTPPTSEGEK